MLINEKLGNLASFRDEGRAIDRLPVQWYETESRTLRRQTGSGRMITLSFTEEAFPLQQDDVLYADARVLIVVEVPACEAIVLKPDSTQQMTLACYLAGYLRRPLFYEQDQLVIPFEPAVFQALQAMGFELQLGQRKLLNPLRIAGMPQESSQSKRENIFTRILKRTVMAGE